MTTGPTPESKPPEEGAKQTKPAKGNKTKIIVAVAVVIVGALCLVTAGAMLNNKESPQESTAVLDAGGFRQKGKVVYVNKDIAAGSLIEPEALEEKEMDLSKIPQSALSSASMAAGSYADTDLEEGTIILNEHLKHASIPAPKETPKEPTKKAHHKKHH